jgi:cytochrome c peroxidase
VVFSLISTPIQTFQIMKLFSGMRFFCSMMLVLVLFSCKKDNEIVPVDDWGFKKPSYFPEPHYTFENNAQTKLRFSLGRDLFYDSILSLDNSISCASCHAQTHAFSDHNVAFSAGVNGTLGVRNSPALSNLAWYPTFMWDGGIVNIETFSVGPITNPLEMHESILNVVGKLNANSAYRNKFKLAYDVDSITDQKMLQALAQYMAMLISDDSKYDKFKKGTYTFTADESAGYSLFQAKCATCHTEPLFTDFSYRNNGIDATFTDLGRGMITQNAADNGKFKVPSLRNVQLTYPYMHDGRYFTLAQVLDHYATGIQSSSTLDPSLASGIPLTADEKLKIIAFLKTLTDYTFMANPDLSEPIH